MNQKEKHFSFPFVADPKKGIYNQFANDYIPQCIMKALVLAFALLSIGFASLAEEVGATGMWILDR